MVFNGRFIFPETYSKIKKFWIHLSMLFQVFRIVFFALGLGNFGVMVYKNFTIKSILMVKTEYILTLFNTDKILYQIHISLLTTLI